MNIAVIYNTIMLIIGKLSVILQECNKKRSMSNDTLPFLMAQDGIEPPTQGFSVLCSTD
jgi:hypothetical protein